MTRQLSAVPPNDGPKPELRRLKPRASQNWQQFFASQTKTSSASPRDVEEDHISECSDEKSPITVQELMQASGPILKQYPLKGTSDPTLKKWLQQFPVETLQEATKFAKMFQDAAVPKAKLQEAAFQYGLPMEQSLKFPPRGLQQLIAIAAALNWVSIQLD